MLHFQFPMHVLINPSTAAGAREMLPRRPVINGERAAWGVQERKEEKTPGSIKHATGRN